ncbi:MAG: hypothetical protein ACYSUK_12100, partial [Planctomycetota bacterium]
MGLGWIDVNDIPIEALFLLEEHHIRWLSKTKHVKSMATLLKNNPGLSWFMGAKCPEVKPWVESLVAQDIGEAGHKALIEHKRIVLDSIQDWLIYVLDPSIYDRLPFLDWDSEELLGIA